MPGSRLLRRLRERARGRGSDRTLLDGCIVSHATAMLALRYRLAPHGSWSSARATGSTPGSGWRIAVNAWH